jgi:hypothetical protein
VDHLIRSITPIATTARRTATSALIVNKNTLGEIVIRALNMQVENRNFLVYQFKACNLFSHKNAIAQEHHNIPNFQIFNLNITARSIERMLCCHVNKPSTLSN